LLIYPQQTKIVVATISVVTIAIRIVTTTITAVVVKSETFNTTILDGRGFIKNRFVEATTSFSAWKVNQRKGVI